MKNRRDNMGLNREAYDYAYNQAKKDLVELNNKKAYYENKCNNVSKLIKEFNKNPKTQAYISVRTTENNTEIPLTKDDLTELRGYYLKQQKDYTNYIANKEKEIRYYEDLFKSDKDEMER